MPRLVISLCMYSPCLCILWKGFICKWWALSGWQSMTKVQPEELEDKFILAVLLLIFYAAITNKHFSLAPLSEAELAVWGFLRKRKKNKGEAWAKPLPLVQHWKEDTTSVQPSGEGLITFHHPYFLQLFSPSPQHVLGGNWEITVKSRCYKMSLCPVLTSLITQEPGGKTWTGRDKAEKELRAITLTPAGRFRANASGHPVLHYSTRAHELSQQQPSKPARSNISTTQWTKIYSHKEACGSHSCF